MRGLNTAFKIVRRDADSVNFIYQGKQVYLSVVPNSFGWNWYLVSADSEKPVYGANWNDDILLRIRDKRFMSLSDKIKKCIRGLPQCALEFEANRETK